jgi:hypothetical protein
MKEPDSPYHFTRISLPIMNRRRFIQQTSAVFCAAPLGSAQSAHGLIA